MRRLLTALIASALLLLLATPGAHLLAQAVADSTAAPVAIPSIADLVTHYQMPLVTVVSSILVWLVTKMTPEFAQQANWVKRLTLFAAAVLISLLVRGVGGTLSADVAAILWNLADGGAAALAGGAVFRLAKTQEGNQ